MSKYDLDLGNLMEQVQKAIESVDYKKLNEDISGTIGTAINEVKRSLNIKTKNEETADYEYRDYREVNSSAQNQSQTGESSYSYSDRKNQEQEIEKQYPYGQYSVPARNIGRIPGILMTVFGAIGMGSFGLPLLICWVMWLVSEFEGGDFAITVAAISPFFLASIILFGRGLYLDMRSSRFRKYMRRIGSKTVCSIEELANIIEKSDSYVVKDLKRMINIGMFPEGHMDQEEKCFILDHKTYQYYLETKQQLEQRLREEEEIEQREQDNPRQKELHLVIETGKNYVNQIRKVNDELPEVEISEKLDRMEKVISQIFTCVELHPEKLPEITKFLDYYMPTTLKLVQAYKNFENEPIQTDNIVSSKREIRQIVDTINEAFENLMDSLYDDMAMDISADISVLKTMLAQEGLTGNDFERK